MRSLVLAFAVAMGMGSAAVAQAVSDAPAGDYILDLGHGRLLFRASHLGFSNYTAMFTKFDAQLAFDPAAPESMAVKVQIDPASVETHYPDPAIDFNAVIEGPEFLDTAKFPEMTFVSTAVKLTGANTADVTGDLTLHGVTKPLVLAVTFNGGYAGHPMDPGGARIGFSGVGTLKRSDYGMGFGIPAPGTTLGVSDAVEVIVEAEFINPNAPKP